MMAAVLPRRLFLTGGPEKCRRVCLTFDDGLILSTRRDFSVCWKGNQSDIFVVGRNAGVIRSLSGIANAGHALGNHTWSHSALAGLSSSDRPASPPHQRLLYKSPERDRLFRR